MNNDISYGFSLEHQPSYTYQLQQQQQQQQQSIKRRKDEWPAHHHHQNDEVFSLEEGNVDRKKPPRSCFLRFNFKKVLMFVLFLVSAFVLLFGLFHFKKYEENENENENQGRYLEEIDESYNQGDKINSGSENDIENSEFTGNPYQKKSPKNVMRKKKDSDESKHYDRGKETNEQDHHYTAKKIPTLDLNFALKYAIINKSDQYYNENLEMIVWKLVTNELGSFLNDYLWQLSLNITKSIDDEIINKPSNTEIDGSGWKFIDIDIFSIMLQHIRKNMNVRAVMQKIDLTKKTSPNSFLLLEYEEYLNKLLESRMVKTIVQIFIKSNIMKCCCKPLTNKFISASLLTPLSSSSSSPPPPPSQSSLLSSCSQSQPGLYNYLDLNQKQNTHWKVSKDLLFCAMGLNNSSGSGDLEGSLLLKFGIKEELFNHMVSGLYYCDMQLVLQDANEKPFL